MKRKHLSVFSRFGFSILVLGFLLVGEGNAQVISGDLVGTVLDKTGAAVPGASIEAVNVETGVKYTTKGNDAGEYRFTNLPVGLTTFLLRLSTSPLQPLTHSELN